MDRHIHIESTTGDDTSRSIVIHQDADIGVGGTIWDAAIQLTYYLMKQYNITAEKQQSSFLSNKSICCLSSGTGVEGIAVACFDSIQNTHIVLTDIDEHVKLMQRNIDVNKHIFNPSVTVTSHSYFWGDSPHELSPGTGGKFDVVLIADILYRPELYDQLLMSLQALSHSNTIILMCNEVREQVQHPLYMQQMYDRLRQTFKVERVHTSELHDEYQCDTIELYRCTIAQLT